MSSVDGLEGKLAQMRSRSAQNGTPGTAGTLSLPRALADLVRHPLKVLALWNWKSACLSILLRGPIFLVASIRQGLGAVLGALVIECAFCMGSAGFYGAVVQSVRDAQPEWLTVTFVAVIMPVAFQALEFFLHYLHGTPHLLSAELVSVFAGGISALFTWYVMRRGALLVGEVGGGFLTDLGRLPILLFRFVAAAPLWWLRRFTRPTARMASSAPPDRARGVHRDIHADQDAAPDEFVAPQLGRD